MEDANTKAQELSRIGQNLKSKLIDGLKGVGNTKGGGVGDGRGERMLRWIMVFNTTNGADYLSQLMDLNARIAFPDPDKPGKFLVISNLGAKPITTMELDLSTVSDIFWVDDKAQSVSNLSRAMGLQIKAEAFVVLMPVSVEEKLQNLKKPLFKVLKRKIFKRPVLRLVKLRANMNLQKLILSLRRSRVIFLVLGVFVGNLRPLLHLV